MYLELVPTLSRKNSRNQHAYRVSVCLHIQFFSGILLSLSDFTLQLRLDSDWTRIFGKIFQNTCYFKESQKIENKHSLPLSYCVFYWAWPSLWMSLQWQPPGGKKILNSLINRKTIYIFNLRETLCWIENLWWFSGLRNWSFGNFEWFFTFERPRFEVDSSELTVSAVAWSKENL